MPTFYDILSVSKEASAEDIKSAYRRLVVRYHPDKNPDNLHAKEKFIQIQQAYEVLSDSTKKYHYDIKLRDQELYNQVHSQQQRTPRRPAPRRSGTRRSYRSVTKQPPIFDKIFRLITWTLSIYILLHSTLVLIDTFLPKMERQTWVIINSSNYDFNNPNHYNGPSGHSFLMAEDGTRFILPEENAYKLPKGTPIKVEKSFLLGLPYAISDGVQDLMPTFSQFNILPILLVGLTASILFLRLHFKGHKQKTTILAVSVGVNLVILAVIGAMWLSNNPFTG